MIFVTASAVGVFFLAPNSSPIVLAREHVVTVSGGGSFSLPGLSAGECERIVWEAFREWDTHCGVGFTRGSGGFFTLTLTARPMTQYSAKFSGWPTLGGEIVFNSGVRWDRAMLKRVTLHEIGHFLGRNHSEDAGSVMYERPRVSRLGPGDIEEAVRIWGGAE